MKTPTKKKSAKRKGNHQPTAPTPPPPISVTLSPESSALVRWYVETVGHRERETVDGVVFTTLESALDAYQERPRGDDAFDMALRATLESKDRFLNSDNLGAHARETVEVDEKATLLLRERLQQTGHDVRDVVSAAVVFLLAKDDEDEHTISREALAAAKARRLALEGKEAA